MTRSPPVAAAASLACPAAAFAAAAEFALFGLFSADAGLIVVGLPFLVIIFVAAFIVAIPHLLLIGLPLYYLLRRFMRVGWRTCAAAGFLVGALPLSLVGPIFSFENWLFEALVTGLPGLAAGLAFGRVLHRHQRGSDKLAQAEIFA